MILLPVQHIFACQDWTLLSFVFAAWQSAMQTSKQHKCQQDTSWQNVWLVQKLICIFRLWQMNFCKLWLCTSIFWNSDKTPRWLKTQIAIQIRNGTQCCKIHCAIFSIAHWNFCKLSPKIEESRDLHPGDDWTKCCIWLAEPSFKLCFGDNCSTLRHQMCGLMSWVQMCSGFSMHHSCPSVLILSQVAKLEMIDHQIVFPWCGCSVTKIEALHTQDVWTHIVSPDLSKLFTQSDLFCPDSSLLQHWG